MNHPSSSADGELPDRLLRLDLEKALSQHFYQACDRQIQILLSQCQWYITTCAEVTTLAIECSDIPTKWRILKSLVPIATTLKEFSHQAKIRICPPPGMGTPLEMRVDELSVYQD